MQSNRLTFYCILQVLSLFTFYSSPSTPFDLATAVSASLAEMRGRPAFCMINAAAIEDLSPEPEAVVFDYTYRAEFAVVLRSKDNIVVGMWEEEVDLEEGYIAAFAHYLKVLNFTRVRVITDTENANLRLSRRLQTSFPLIVDDQELVLPVGVSTESALLFAGTTIKSSGATLYAVFTTPNTTAALLSALEAKKLNKAGFAYMLSDSARYLPSVLSSVPLANSGLLAVTREESYLAVSREAGEASILSKRWRLVLADVYERPVPAYCLMNMQNSKPVRVSSALQSLIFPIMFPGNSTMGPKGTEVAIPVSINTRFLNADGSVFPFSAIIMRGYTLAFENVNNRTDILVNFIVDAKSVPLSGYVFNHSFTNQQVQIYYKQLGLAHFPPPLINNVVETYQILEAYNYLVPLITSTRNDKLSSSEHFPYLLRTRTGNEYLANVLAQVFKIFKWRRLAIIYSNDENEEAYLNFLNYSSALGLTITNDQNMRAIPKELTTPDQKARFNQTIAHIMQSTVRIILMLSSDLTTVIEGMYDMGVRSEYLVVCITGLAGALFDPKANAEHYKAKAVLKGALQFYPRMFIGKEGERVLRLLVTKDGNNYYPNGCAYFDGAMLYTYATDYMIQQGLNYEDRDELMKAMRSTRFKGCIGIVRIGQNTNDPSDQIFSIMNAKYFAENDTTVVRDAYYYDPFSVSLIKQINEVGWPDDSQGVYLDTLVFPCPFPDSTIRDFASGEYVAFSVCFFLCLLCAFAVILSYCKRDASYPQMVGKHEMSLDDFLRLLDPIIEFLQFVVFSPHSRLLTDRIPTLMLDASGSLYWRQLHLALGWGGGWTLICLVKLARLERVLEWIPGCPFLLLFINVVMPTAAAWLFLPILSTLLKVYLCTQATGAEFTSSFLDSDCFQSCWNVHHITYVISGSIVLLCYTVLTLYTSPLWQDKQPLLHIKAHPRSLLIQFLARGVVAALDRTLNLRYLQAHNWCFMSVLGLYFLYLLRFPLYNYSR